MKCTACRGREADAVGLDIAPRIIAPARAKAAQRELSARFEVTGALNPGALGAASDTVIDIVIDTVIDNGLFFTLDVEARESYIAGLARRPALITTAT